MNPVLQYLEQIKATYQNFSTSQKILSVGSALILLASLAYLVYTVNKVEYSPLYSGLAQEEMGSVVESLKNKKIPYQLSEKGVISVPKEQVHETRLTLAKDGIPKGSGVGFELFDQQKLGSSEFVQKINYQRALQGELSRTINEMNAVMESRVHLVIPEKSLFVEDQKAPSASVALKLHPGKRLDQSEIQGIVHLVASAVQGMKEENVTVISTDGKILFKKDAQDTPLQMSNLQLEYKSRMEEEYHRKVQSMLEQVMGASKAITRVTLDLDFSQVKMTEDTYDPDSSVIRSQQRSVESSDGKDGTPKGNPDVPINVESKLLQSSPQGGGTGKDKDKDQQQKSTFNRQRETVNYEINHVNRQTVRTPGNVKKLSVAVVIDGAYEMKPDKDGNMKHTFVGRTADEMKSVEEMVKKAVGYDEARGDQIAVSNTPFVSEFAEMEMAKAENRWVKMFESNQKLLTNLFIILLVFFLLIRPIMKKFQQIGEKAEAAAEAAAALPEGAETAGALPPPEEVLSLRKQAIQLVRDNPERATEIVRSWLREEA